MGTGTTSSSSTPEPSTIEASKNDHLSVFPKKQFNHVTFPAVSEGSNHPAPRFWLWSPLGNWWILAQPQLPGATKSKGGGLYAWPSMLLNTLSLPPSSLVALSPLHLYLDLLLPLTAIRYWYWWLWKVEIYVMLSLALGFPGGSDR